MKKTFLILFSLILSSFAAAELIVDIPFEMNIVGDSFASGGAYTYESEWMTATNNGTETQTYTIEYSYQDLPADWSVSLCTTSSCLMPNFPTPLELAAGESEQFHVSIYVNSCGGFPFNLTFDAGDLVEPLSLDFTFNTEDNVSAQNQLVSKQKLHQNFPNPFNPETSISYQLTASEAKSSQLNIYNQKGQLIKSFSNLSSDEETIVWKGKDDHMRSVSSGIYFYRLEGAVQTDLKKMILLR